MESYVMPKSKARKIFYQIEKPGDESCDHELKPDFSKNRLSTESGIVFASFTCEKCGRELIQTVGELLSPETWC